jgi:hypothetical protein
MVTLSDSQIAANGVRAVLPDLTQCGRPQLGRTTNLGGSQMSKLGVEWGGRGVEWGGRGGVWRGGVWRGGVWR